MKKERLINLILCVAGIVIIWVILTRCGKNPIFPILDTFSEDNSYTISGQSGSPAGMIPVGYLTNNHVTNLRCLSQSFKLPQRSVIKSMGVYIDLPVPGAVFKLSIFKDNGSGLPDLINGFIPEYSCEKSASNPGLIEQKFIVPITVLESDTPYHLAVIIPVRSAFPPGATMAIFSYFSAYPDGNITIISNIGGSIGYLPRPMEDIRFKITASKR